MMLLKKTMYDRLVTKVNHPIDTTGYVLKTQNKIDKSVLEKKTDDAD